MNSIFAKILYELEKGHDLMLVTIIAEQGSAPRGTGAQMLVGREGRILGTVGGGPAEEDSINRALKLIAEKRSEVHEYRLHANAEEDIGSVCGGDVDVMFSYIAGDSTVWKDIAGAVVRLIAEKAEAWLVLPVCDAPAVIGADGKVFAGEIKSGMPLTGEGCRLDNGIFTVRLPIGERAVIFGGGHCAAALAPLLATVGFRVTVMDCREEFANRERFPFAEEVICGSYEHISDYLTITENDYIVVMTNGHSFDFTVQEQILRLKTAYVGVIGSKSKKASVNAKLLEAGVPAEAVESVHTPVGMAIKAVTPEEIAVSIAGEMILVRAQYREAAGIVTHSCPMH